MSKGTTIKEALQKWEEKETPKKASESTEVKLLAQYPPIEKMDASLSTLVRCEKLSLSSNNIEKIANLNGLKHLKILSLARNNIKSFTGLEAVADTLEELWISHNNIEKLKGLNVLKKLKVLYMSNNNVKDHAEFVKLADLPYLEELLFLGNPMIETWNEDQHKMTYKEYAEQKLAKLKKLDGVPVVRKDEE